MENEKEVLAALLQKAKDKLQLRETLATFENLLKDLEPSGIRAEHLAWLDDASYAIKENTLSEVDCGLPVIQSLLKWKEIDSYGGEGQGETWWKVYWVPDYEFYVKVDGHYQSHCGVEFYGNLRNHLTKVIPKEKTITVYENA